jgi:hypothetical protein
MLRRNIRRLAEKNRKTYELYLRLSFLRKIPIMEFGKIRKVSLILRAKPYSLLSYPRLSKLYEIAVNLSKERIDGGFVECGVCNGGSAGVVAKVLKSDKNRHVWLFDSWEGCPTPTPYDVAYTGQQGERGEATGSEEKVKELLFKRLLLSPNNIHLVKGWFEDTIPSVKEDIGKIAFLHLDCDWYKSVKFCLENLYDEVTEGGYVVIDDYGHWKGCRKAVDEFIGKRKLRVRIHQIDYTGAYFQK